MFALFIIFSLTIIVISEWSENPQFREKVRKYINSINE